MVNPKFVEDQPQVLRLRLAHNHPSDEDLSPGTPVNHPSDEDLSPGTPVTRQSPLRMNKNVE
jgi:hypothetical protein